MSPEQLTASVQAGSLTHQQAVHAYAALYGATPAAPTLRLPCEQCGALVSLADAISYKIWMPKPGRDVPAYDEHDQHFACSHDCAERLAHACITQHMRPEAERRIAQMQAAQAEAAQAEAAQAAQAQGQPS